MNNMITVNSPLSIKNSDYASGFRFCSHNLNHKLNETKYIARASQEELELCPSSCSEL